MQEQRRTAARGLPARDLCLISAFVGAAIVVPMVFHMVRLGQVLLPMHLPILIAGLCLKPRQAALVSVMAPITSMVMTGMPPIIYVIPLTMELVVLALCASVLMNHTHTPGWLVVLISLGARCLCTYWVYGAMAHLLGLPGAAGGAAAVLSGTPGIVLQGVCATPTALWLRRCLQESPRVWEV